jgi:hypothetical protein
LGAIYAGALLYEGFIAPRYSGVFTVPFPDKSAAARQFNTAATSAPAAGRRAMARLLADSDPADPQSWDAVAFAQTTADGRLTPEGVVALERSYTLSFFERDRSVWRVRFALEHWDQLTDQTREDALTEARTALADPDLAKSLRPQLSDIRNSAGRLAALILSGGRSEP